MKQKDEGTQKAIRAVGKAAELASQLGIKPQAISGWKRIPPLRVLDVERITGVPRHELRPDLYPPPSAHEAA